MASPRVLIPIPVQDSEQRRFSLGKNYVNNLVAVGGMPVLLPTTASALDDWQALYASVDGVMLTGGGDVDPPCSAKWRIRPHTALIGSATRWR